MNEITAVFNLKRNGSAWLLDILAILAIYFIPTISHMVGIPFYLFEPMRIFVILSLLHSRKANSYALAIGLPLFSFLISSHPVLLKAGLISFELVINVFLFYLARKRLAAHWAVLISVIFSKIIYYMFKYLFIQFALLESSLISTPLYFQFFTTLAFGLYAFIWIKTSTQKKATTKN
jgi:hypothetical protein